jgi:hypothetical protein
LAEAKDLFQQYKLYLQYDFGCDDIRFYLAGILSNSSPINLRKAIREACKLFEITNNEQLGRPTSTIELESLNAYLMDHALTSLSVHLPNLKIITFTGCYFQYIGNFEKTGYGHQYA